MQGKQWPHGNPTILGLSCETESVPVAKWEPRPGLLRKRSRLLPPASNFRRHSAGLGDAAAMNQELVRPVVAAGDPWFTCDVIMDYIQERSRRKTREYEHIGYHYSRLLQPWDVGMVAHGFRELPGMC